MRYILLFILTIFFSLVSAQEEHHFEDSLRHHMSFRPKVDFRFDARNSFISATRVKFWGFKIGFQYNNKVRIGIGLNTMLKPAPVQRFYPSNELQLTDTVDANLSIVYWCIYIDYVFHRTKRWELSMPVQLGIGGSSYEYVDAKDGLTKNINQKGVMLYEPGFMATYSPIRYVGLGLGIGYRFMIVNNPLIDEQLNSLMYVLKVKVFLGNIYNDIFGRNPSPPEKRKRYRKFDQ